MWALLRRARQGMPPTSPFPQLAAAQVPERAREDSCSLRWGTLAGTPDYIRSLRPRASGEVINAQLASRTVSFDRSDDDAQPLIGYCPALTAYWPLAPLGHQQWSCRGQPSGLRAMSIV